MLWLLAGDHRVGGIREKIAHPRATVLVSAVVMWEAAIKSALGKLKVPDDLPDVIARFSFERLAITDVHTWAVRTLPPVHGDPFDRLLVAQATTEQATIVSADPVFDQYGVPRMW